jgi:hypothetical protein
MTAPFAPSPPWPAGLIVFGLIAIGVLLPIARREDGAGWAALLVVAAVALGLAGAAIGIGGRAILRSWRAGDPGATSDRGPMHDDR